MCLGILPLELGIYWANQSLSYTREGREVEIEMKKPPKCQTEIIMARVKSIQVEYFYLHGKDQFNISDIYWVVQS